MGRPRGSASPKARSRPRPAEPARRRTRSGRSCTGSRRSLRRTVHDHQTAVVHEAHPLAGSLVGSGAVPAFIEPRSTATPFPYVGRHVVSAGREERVVSGMTYGSVASCSASGARVQAASPRPHPVSPGCASVVGIGRRRHGSGDGLARSLHPTPAAARRRTRTNSRSGVDRPPGDVVDGMAAADGRTVVQCRQWSPAGELLRSAAADDGQREAGRRSGGEAAHHEERLARTATLSSLAVRPLVLDMWVIF